MSISNLFEDNDYALKCKNLEVSGDTVHDGNLFVVGNMTVQGDTTLNADLKDQFGQSGANYDILTSTGTATAWRKNINCQFLSSGPTFLTPNVFMGQGYTDANNNFANFVVSQPLTIQCFACRVVNSPGVGNAWVFELYRNGIATGVIATISDVATVASSPIVNIAINQYEVYSIHVSRIGTATATTGSASIDYIFNF